MTNNTTPPHSLEAEESVLGAILVQPAVLADAAVVVQPEDFYHPTHRHVFECMRDLTDERKPVDALTVLERMRQQQQPVDEGWLADLVARVVTVSNVAYYAGIVRAKAERRRTIHVLRELAAAGFSDDGDEEYRETVAAGVLKLLSVPRENRSVPLKTVLREAIATVEKRYESKSTVTGIATGYPELDGMLAGLQPGELVILAGRPSMGKSALAFNVAINAALFASASVLVHSLEMSRGSVGERVLSSDGPVDGMRLRSGRLETRDWLAMTKAAERLAPLAVTIDDSGTLTIADIRARARRWAATAIGRRMVVVDYLQLVTGERAKGGNREQEISSISRGLKQLAKELDCPVLALSQLSRALESRSDKRPIMSDLRESGAIEQDADVIAFVYRDEVYNPESDDKGVAEVIIGKQRNGPVGTVKLRWESRFSRFDSRAGVS